MKLVYHRISFIVKTKRFFSIHLDCSSDKVYLWPFEKLNIVRLQGVVVGLLFLKERSSNAKHQ